MISTLKKSKRFTKDLKSIKRLWLKLKNATSSRLIKLHSSGITVFDSDRCSSLLARLVSLKLCNLVILRDSKIFCNYKRKVV